jgi:formylglycine-generating enzyme required for sulfatase activity
MKFSMRNPNELTPRQAMGLPAGFSDRLPPDLIAENADLLSFGAQALVTVLESTVEPAPRRFAAGTVLAMIGDPRIHVFEPPMVALTGGSALLGLAPERVDAVVSQWRHVGVQTDWIRKECPRHEVKLTPFAIGRFPVTNLEYRTFLEETGRDDLPSSWLFGAYPLHFANHPVWTVSPKAADAYAAWLARRKNRAFRLPTEAEWEYAATQGDGREFPWGDEPFDPSRANTVEGGPLRTTPVGMFPRGRTSSGIDDLAGNVEEYTSDLYKAYPGGELVPDDLLKTFGDYRVARGGGFTRFGDLARCQRRHGWYQSPIYAMGFRLAETL